MRVDNATLSRLRECAVYDVCVAGMDRAFLAFLASEGLSSMCAALLARVSAVGQPVGALYRNALIASDVDATICTSARSLARRRSSLPSDSRATRNE